MILLSVVQVYFRGSERIVFRFALMKKYVSDNCCIKVGMVFLALNFLVSLYCLTDNEN